MREQNREVMFNDADLMERSDASAALRLHSVLHQEECAQRALEEEQQRQSTEEARFPPDKPLRVCKHCMKMFVADRKNAVFCTAQCKNQYHVDANRKK